MGWLLRLVTARPTLVGGPDKERKGQRGPPTSESDGTAPDGCVTPLAGSAKVNFRELLKHSTLV